MKEAKPFAEWVSFYSSLDERAIELVGTFIEESTNDLTQLLSLSASPIEQVMAIALYDVISHYNERRSLIKLEAQAEIKAESSTYKADFLIQYGLCDHGDDAVKIIVECDGHQYHEKTKEQAQKDKKRDRALQYLGYIVLHYTGSEIWRYPKKCAMEAFFTFLKAVQNKWPTDHLLD